MSDARKQAAVPRETTLGKTGVITPEMTILDIISQHRETEKVFKRLEVELGVCVCCQGLFLPLGEAADRFGFDLGSVMTELNAFIHPDCSKRVDRTPCRDKKP